MKTRLLSCTRGVEKRFRPPYRRKDRYFQALEAYVEGSWSSNLGYYGGLSESS